MNKDKIKKLLQDKLEPPFWDSDFEIIHEVYVNEIKEMVKNKKATCFGNPEWMLSIEDRIKNETLDDIITNLTQDTNPKE